MVLLVPVSPITKSQFEHCCTAIEAVCSDLVPLNSLNTLPSWRNWNIEGRPRGDLAFESFSWASGAVHCAIARSSSTNEEVGINPSINHEPHRTST